VEPVRPGTLTGPIPSPKPCLYFFIPTEPVGFTGLPVGFLGSWEPVWGTLAEATSGRVPRTVGNRTGSAGSRWNRSDLVHELVRFPIPNRAYIFFIPIEPVGFTGLPAGFFVGTGVGAVWGTLTSSTFLVPVTAGPSTSRCMSVHNMISHNVQVQ
jgi:hypothetical protein